MIRQSTTVLAALLLLCACDEGPTAPAASPLGHPQADRVPASSFTSVSAGDFHTCGMLSTGDAECWGSNAAGQARKKINGPLLRVSAGGSHTCALKSDGVINCWGSSAFGQAPSVRRASLDQFVDVDAGDEHTCGLRGDGVIECWGNNRSGQAPSTQKAGAGLTYVAVSAGYARTCATRNDGAVVCWGALSDIPATFAPLNGGSFTGLSVGTQACVLETNTLTCAGSTIEKPPAGIFSQVSAGWQHNCAIDLDTVNPRCWGSNSHGQTDAAVIWTVPGEHAEVASGKYHSCLLTPTRNIVCWGDNTYGQAPLSREPSN